MDEKILLLFLALLSSVIFISAVSQNTSSANNSLGDHQESVETIEKRKNLHWTPELQSDLLLYWDKTVPEYKGHAQRIHKLWSVNHPEYSHIKATHLKRYAEKIIRKREKSEFHKDDEQQQIRSRIIEGRKRFQWTPKLKKSLIKCHDTIDTDSPEYTEEMHQFWVTRNPEYADMKPEFLNDTIKKILGAQKGKGQVQNRKRVEWDDKLNLELMNIWEETYDFNKTGQAERINKKWKFLHPESKISSHGYLKYRADSLIYDDIMKRISNGEDSEQLRSKLEYIKRYRNRSLWSPELISKLLNSWDKSASGNEERVERWKKLYPEHANVNSKYLIERVNHFRRLRREAELNSVKGKGIERPSTNHGVTFKRILNLERSNARQNSISLPRRTGLNQEYNVSSGLVHQFMRNPHREYNASFDRTPRPSQFMSHYQIYEPELTGFHQGYENQDDRRHTPHQNLSLESKSHEHQEDLDLDLHLK